LSEAAAKKKRRTALVQKMEKSVRFNFYSVPLVFGAAVLNSVQCEISAGFFGRQMKTSGVVKGFQGMIKPVG
jgi:hypothetical protein